MNHAGNGSHAPDPWADAYLGRPLPSTLQDPHTQQRLVLQNRDKEPYTVWLEPWGADYTALPGERMEVIARGCSADFYYHVDHLGAGAQVYVEGHFEEVGVFQDGVMLPCGHHRRSNQG